VAGRPGFSVQTLSVLAALCAEPASWRHGYGIAKDTGLQSGSLYPILIRLAERGLVEARWEEEQPAGRPRRHLYRLTPDGLAAASAALAEQARLKHRHTAAGRAGGRRVAREGA
jgi:PadR family transcriptional regulator, regulatory protein PadR